MQSWEKNESLQPLLPTPSFDVTGNIPTKYGGDISLY